MGIDLFGIMKSTVLMLKLNYCLNSTRLRHYSIFSDFYRARMAGNG